MTNLDGDEWYGEWLADDPPRDSVEDLPAFITVQEAADYMGVSLRTMRRWIAQDKVTVWRPVNKRGCTVRIVTDSLLWLAE